MPKRIQALMMSAFLIFLTSTGCRKNTVPIHPSGTFEAVEVNLSPTLTSVVLETRAEEGDRVQQGDTLLVLDTELLWLKREQTRVGLNNLAAKIRAAEAQLKPLERTIAFQQLTLERLSSLHQEGSATTQQLDEITAQRDITTEQLTAGRANIDALRVERESLTAALAVLDRQLKDGILTAPCKGMVLLKTADPGEIAAPGMTAYRIADLSRLELRVYLDEGDLGKVKIGQPVKIAVDALRSQTRDGVVSWISSEAEFTPKNAQTRDARAELVYAVKVRIDNPDGTLHIGMPAELIL